MKHDGGIFSLNLGFETSAQKIRGKKSQILSRLASQLSYLSGKFILFLFVSVAYAVTFVYFPKVVGEIIDVFAEAIITSVLGLKNNGITDAVAEKTVVAIVLFLLNAFFAYLQGHIVSDIVTSFSMKLKRQVACKYNALPITYFDNIEHRNIVKIITDDIDALSQSLNLFLLRTITAIILFVCVIIVQFTVDTEIALVSLVVSMAGVLITTILNKIENRTTAKKTDAENNLTYSAEEFYSGLQIVQRSGKVENVVRDLYEKADALSKRKRKSGFMSALQSGVSEFASAFCVVAVTAAGITRIVSGYLTLGILQTQIIYVRKMFQSFSELTMSFSLGRSLLFSSEKIFDFFDVYEEKRQGLVLAEQKEKTPQLTVKNVNFRYDKDSAEILKNVTFTVDGKGITAVSGETGVGKTTLLKLILGFYKPQKGEILYDGININNLSLEQYRKKFNVIVQGATLFNDTIANNISYSTENVTFDEIKKAAESCNADEFISKLPDGYNTVFDAENPNLSNGEIQLILLARSFLRKSEFIIFDEATSNLDVKNEKLIAEKLAELSKECGVIIITHSRFAKKYADKTIHIKSGEVD